MEQKNNVTGWRFTDGHGTFSLTAPHHTTGLYFPLVNDSGLMSAITPTLHGDIKTGQNAFLTAPVSLEDLHNTRSARNFWVYIDGYGPWSATGNSARHIADDDDQVTLEAGLLWHKVTRENAAAGLRADITNVVPMMGHNVELMRVSLTNITAHPLTLTPTTAIPIYGRSADNLRDHRHVTSLLHRITIHPAGVIVQPTLAFDERGHVANTTRYGVFGCTSESALPASFIPVLEDFIGEGGSLVWPQAITAPECVRGVGAGYTVDGYEAIGALRFEPVTLAAGETATYILMLAILEPDDDPDQWINTYNSAAKFTAALESCQSYWRDKAAALTFHTADETYDQWLRWVGIQPLLRRLFGNSFLPAHDYGRGGRGWRDLWQDCLALLLTEPDDVPDLLFSSFAGVRFDGSNATIIGAKPGEFVADRNNIPRVWMDHGAWPYLTTHLYIDQSGDLDFLLREQTYFKDTHIDRCTAHDAQWQPQQGTHLRTHAGETVCGSVLEHLLVQHLTAFFHVGEHNIIRLEGADWNDGMDMARERGESVAFTALYAGNLAGLSALITALAERGHHHEIALAAELVPLLDTLTDPVDYASVEAKTQRLAHYFTTCARTLSGEKVTLALHDIAADLDAKAAWLFDHLRRQEWITDRAGLAWFNGYYDNDGKRVEGDHVNGVRMTLIGQVFTLMGGIATGAQAREIVRAADTYLLEPALGGYRLNTDFGEVKTNLGRCFGYAFGHKENGAMFSHMAVMYANALYKRGLIHAGHRVLAGIFEHCGDFATSRMYPGIPEYINARGRGMYTYLTGSASWLLLTLTNEVFGVKGSLGDLVLAPQLLSEQFDTAGSAAINVTFAGRVLRITYHNPTRLDAGTYRIGAVTLDGKPVQVTPDNTGVHIDRAILTALDPVQSHTFDVELVTL